MYTRLRGPLIPYSRFKTEQPIEPGSFIGLHLWSMAVPACHRENAGHAALERSKQGDSLMKLEQLGWNSFFEVAWSEVENTPSKKPARVIAQHRELWRVAGEFGETSSKATGKLRLNAETVVPIGLPSGTGFPWKVASKQSCGSPKFYGVVLGSSARTPGGEWSSRYWQQTSTLCF